MYETYQRLAPDLENFGSLLDKGQEPQVPTMFLAADADMAPPSHRKAAATSGSGCEVSTQHARDVPVTLWRGTPLARSELPPSLALAQHPPTHHALR
jgi:hypothetical protein